jgi:ferredoxin-thioredoxin reductase catalytic subunit
VNQENGFVSQCSAGSEEPGDRHDYGSKSLPGECYQKKNDDFKCFNQPCYYVPPGAGANEWCCHGHLFRSCEAKIVVEGRSAYPDVTGGESAESQASEYDETSTTDADAGGGTGGGTKDIESGARLSYTACNLFGNVKVAALFVAGLLSFLPIATHVM